MMAAQSCLLSVAARRGYFRDIMMVVLNPKIVSCLERKLTCRRWPHLFAFCNRIFFCFFWLPSSAIQHPSVSRAVDGPICFSAWIVPCLLRTVSCSFDFCFLIVAWPFVHWKCIVAQSLFFGSMAPPVVRRSCSHNVRPFWAVGISCLSDADMDWNRSASSTKAKPARLKITFVIAEVWVTPYPSFLKISKSGELTQAQIAGPAPLPWQMPCGSRSHVLPPYRSVESPCAVRMECAIRPILVIMDWAAAGGIPNRSMEQ